MKLHPLGFCILLASASLCPAADAPPPASPAELVRQLGDESFAVRRQASDRILALGAAAEGAVRAGLTNRDLEVRQQCAALLPRLLAADREARLKAFLADTQDKQKHDLPGWPRFGKAAGGGLGARQLFLEALRGDEALLRTWDKGPKAVAAPFAARCNGLALEVSGPAKDFSLGKVAALLCVAADPSGPLDRPALDGLNVGLEVLAHRAELAKQVRARPAFRKLLLAFLKERSAPANLPLALRLAAVLELKDATDWAVTTATDAKATPAARGEALLLLGRLGEKGTSPRLVPLLADTTVIGTRLVNRTLLKAEVRDLALAALVQMNGQTLADYGFPYVLAVPGLKVVPEPACLGFATPAERDAALRRWRDR